MDRLVRGVRAPWGSSRVRHGRLRAEADGAGPGGMRVSPTRRPRRIRTGHDVGGARRSDVADARALEGIARARAVRPRTRSTRRLARSGSIAAPSPRSNEGADSGWNIADPRRLPTTSRSSSLRCAPRVRRRDGALARRALASQSRSPGDVAASRAEASPISTVRQPSWWTSDGDDTHPLGARSQSRARDRVRLRSRGRGAGRRGVPLDLQRRLVPLVPRHRLRHAGHRRRAQHHGPKRSSTSSRFWPQWLRGVLTSR